MQWAGPSSTFGTNQLNCPTATNVEDTALRSIMSNHSIRDGDYDNDDDVDYDDDDDDTDEEDDEEHNAMKETFIDMCLQVAKDDPQCVNFNEFQYQNEHGTRVRLTDFDAMLLGQSLVGNTHLRFLSLDMTAWPPNHGAPTRTEQVLVDGLTQSRVSTLILGGASQPFQNLLYGNINNRRKLKVQSLDLCTSSVDTAALDIVLRRSDPSPSVPLKMRHPQLLRLSLGYCSLNDSDMLAISRALAENRHLITLVFTHNNITDVGIRYFCQSWNRHSLLRELNLVANEIGPSGAQLLLQTIAQRRSMQSLEIGGNEKIGYQGLAFIGELLPQIGLERLEMEKCVEGSSLIKAKNCPESEAMARSIAEGLRRNKSLKVLNFGANGLGPLGAQLIMQALAGHPSLEGLSFCGDTSIGFAGLKRIGKELPHVKLLGLHLDGTVHSWPNPQTKLARAAGQALLDGVKNNTSMTNVTFQNLIPMWKVPITFLVDLNFKCRPLFSSSALTQSAWPHILAYFDRKKKTGYVFFCLREQPWLVRSGTK